MASADFSLSLREPHLDRWRKEITGKDKEK
jgi:hypothetical protein